MNETTFEAVLSRELPLVGRALRRRFPATTLTSEHLSNAARRAAEQCWKCGELFPVTEAEFFSWLDGVAFRQHVVSIVAVVIERIRVRVTPLCRRLGVEADDVVQDAWVNAQQAIERRGETGQFPSNPEAAEPWFLTVASNAAHDRRRAMNRRPAVPLNQDHPVPEPVDVDDPSELLRCVKGLPPEQRSVIDQLIEGRKPAAISEMMNVPVKQVYYLIRRAKLHLSSCLGEESDEATKS
jgi:RNA polymerase sigma factor (sigma-70 family)